MKFKYQFTQKIAKNKQSKLVKSLKKPESIKKENTNTKYKKKIEENILSNNEKNKENNCASK